MNKSTVFNLGSIAFIILGIIHSIAHFLGKPQNGEGFELMSSMQNFKINLLGEHNLLKFYNGFSIMMGFLLSAFGIQNFILRKEILNNEGALITTIILTFISFVLAILYFHILAYGFIFFSLICFLVVYFRKKSI